MTTEQKYQAITQAIRKALPRLMELREGCLVRKDGEIFRVHEDLNKRNGYNIDRYFYLYKDSIEKEYEIIGHDIMLNDVLEVLPKLLPPENRYYSEEIYLSSDGEFYRTYLNYKDANELEYLHHSGWNLSKPYLKDQSEELIDFLYNLIRFYK